MYYTDGKAYIIRTTKVIDDVVYGDKMYQVPKWLARCQGVYFNHWLRMTAIDMQD
jgi:hypothetical protein